MDRRGFFTQLLKKTAKSALAEADRRVGVKAAHWIRPPYAKTELDFLLACSRCGDCLPACPHHTVFALPARLGAQVAGTPALDLLVNACHLCEDWPCVQACETGALSFPACEEDAPDEAVQEKPPLPVLARARIDTHSCLPYRGPECGACEASCPVPGALVFELARPRIDETLCTGCALCRQACVTEPKSVLISARRSEPDAAPEA